jgi:PIN domain nuclease of toxin-antitoxin system
VRLLLDTHVLLWFLATPSLLREDVCDVISDPSNEVYFSAATIWEIAIKAGLGRADFGIGPNEIAQEARDCGFTSLPVDIQAAAHVALLPPIHRDPFDRLLVAQAILAPMMLYTADAKLRSYSDLVHLVR